MNAGHNWKNAIQHGIANAKRTGTDRYIFAYGGVFWLDTSRIKNSTVIHPNDTIEDVVARARAKR